VNLILRALSLEVEDAALLAHQELAADGFEFLLDLQSGEPWAAYITRINGYGRGESLPSGYVPMTYLLAFVDGEVVGRTSIRHTLNDFLLNLGGHIGYGVRPAHRRRGHATEILRQSLAITQTLGIKENLVTCDDDNVGSRAVVEQAGGVLEDVRDGKRRYWINP
jgi:predicted acetyltransferase